MIIERKKYRLTITIENSNNQKDIQSALDYLRYLEITSKARKVKKSVIKNLAQETNRNIAEKSRKK